MPLHNSKPVDFDTVWGDVELAIQSMLSVSTHFSHEKWLQLYTGIYKVCTNPNSPQSEALYFRLKALLEDHANSTLESLQRSLSDTELLKNYCKAFNQYSTGFGYGKELFTYLNRYWIKTTHCETGQVPIPGVYAVGEMSLRVWHDIVLRHESGRLVKAVLDVFYHARETQEEDIDMNSTIAKLTAAHIALGQNRQDPLKYYRMYLEDPFLRETAIYYAAKSSQLLENFSISVYLKKAEALIKAEERRCEECLHRITSAQAKKVCWKALLGDKAEEVCRDVDEYFKTDSREDLERLFCLLSMTNEDSCLLLLKNVVKKYIETEGMRVIARFSDESAIFNPVEYIEAILEVRTKYQRLVESTFSKNLLMRSALDQGCSRFINKHPKSAELLARYSHILLDRIAAGKSTPNNHGRAAYIHIEEGEIEKKINAVGVIFCLLEDKDIFEKFYSKFLARRLIHGTSISDDLEVGMIQKLRELCGGEFVSKLQRMLTDKKLNQDVNESFTKWLRFNASSSSSDLVDKTALREAKPIFDFSVMILTSGSWPLQSPSTEFVVPIKLQHSIQSFSEFYASQSTGRCLHWLYSMSRGEITANCFSSRYDLQVSTFQMAILLLFNDADQLSLRQISEATKLNLMETQLNVLAFIKLKVLLSEPKMLVVSSTPNPDTIITINYEFSNRRSKIKILPVAHHETPQEAVTTHQEVSEDRKMVVQAAIVRVMKTRRELDHNTLVVQVIELLRHQFVPSVPMLKKNIEILIEKEYMRRLDGSVATYVYIA